MAARTSVPENYHCKKLQDENMGSFLSSTFSERRNSSRLQIPGSSREALGAISKNKPRDYIEDRKDTFQKSDSHGAPQVSLSVTNQNTKKNIKKYPGKAQNRTNTSSKLSIGTPRPQKQQGRATSASSATSARTVPSSKRVILADCSGGKDTEGRGIYRQGTPHPRRKRDNLCPKTLDAGGDSTDKNSAALEKQCNLTNTFESEDSADNCKEDQTGDISKTIKEFTKFNADVSKLLGQSDKPDSLFITSDSDSDVDVVRVEERTKGDVEQIDVSVVEQCVKRSAPGAPVLSRKLACTRSNALDASTSSNFSDVASLANSSEVEVDVTVTSGAIEDGRESDKQNIKYEKESETIKKESTKTQEETRKRKISVIRSPARVAPKRLCRIQRELKGASGPSDLLGSCQPPASDCCSEQQN